MPNRLIISDSRVRDVLAAYHREFPAVLDLFDGTNPGPHDELLPIDVLAVNALNAFGARTAPMTPMTEAWIRRDAIARRVASITRNSIEVLAQADRESQLAPITDALIEIDNIPGFGETATTKLLHRLRPNVVPIWDSRVQQWYPEPEYVRSWTNWLRRVYGDVLGDENRACLEGAKSVLRVCVSILRVWDILLWQIGGEVF